MSKKNVKVVFEFRDVEADDDNYAKLLADNSFVQYIYHPQTNKLIQPEFYVETVEDEFVGGWSNKDENINAQLKEMLEEND